MKKVTLNYFDIEHLFELAYENFQYKCYSCDKLKAKLRKFLGKATADKIVKMLKKHPYGGKPLDKRKGGV